MEPWNFIFLLFTLTVRGSSGDVQSSAIMTGNGGCPRDQLHRCVKTAEPLLRNPDYVFPSTTEDIATVCRLWNEFVECVTSYTAMCLSSDHRQPQLQRAMEEAVRSVDEMCTNPIYQADYLRHAPCIKSMATEDGKCRKQLGHLVDQVSALSISNIQICCAHHSFRECMLSATYRYCRTPLDGSAVQFSRDMFSKSLAFLLKQCEDYVPNSSDCPTAGVTAQDVWETPVQHEAVNTRPVAFSNNEFLPVATTRRSNNFAWNPQTTTTTYRPWFAGGSNSLDSPKQQGLFSGGGSVSSSLLFLLPIVYIMFLLI